MFAGLMSRWMIPFAWAAKSVGISTRWTIAVCAPVGLFRLSKNRMTRRRHRNITLAFVP
jgi:hypothetical protein